MDIIEETIEPAVEFIKSVKHGRVAIVHGHDNDSISSAAIINKLLNKLKIESKLIVSDLNFEISENVVDAVKRFKSDYVIAVDLAEVQVNVLLELRNISKVMIIDHHKPKGYVKITYVNPRIYDNSLYIPATYLCYKIYERFFDVKEILWIAGVGTLSDMGMKNCNDLFLTIKKWDNELVENNPNDDETLFDNSVLGKLAKVFDSARVANGVDGCLVALDILTNYDNYNDVLISKGVDAKKLIEWYTIVDKEFSRLTKDFGKKRRKIKQIILYEIKSKYNMKSSLSGYLSKFMDTEVLVVYQKSRKYIEVSFRRGKISAVDLNIMASKSVEKIPDATGGGHPMASGARFPVKYLTKFLNNIRKV